MIYVLAVVYVLAGFGFLRMSQEDGDSVLFSFVTFILWPPLVVAGAFIDFLHWFRTDRHYNKVNREFKRDFKRQSFRGDAE